MSPARLRVGGRRCTRGEKHPSALHRGGVVLATQYDREVADRVLCDDEYLLALGLVRTRITRVGNPQIRPSRPLENRDSICAV